jgi:site-specific DNA recombinase
MTKNVIAYTRVSTDEQANHGFSLPHQEQVILAYCRTKNYTVIQIVKEDYSAKTFNRPEWNKILSFIKAKRNAVDAIVCLRWDRFSRNSEESLRTIRELKDKYGVEIETVEQPIDLTIPENKVMLAVYLTVPEIENQKNSIRTKDGSRRARLEGCWTGTAPFGYANIRDGLGKSTLIPNKDAEYVKEAFDLMATGIYSAEEVRKRLRAKGVKLVKQSFVNLLRNVAYLGKVTVSGQGKEPAQIVPGLQKPIVEVDTFNKVQNVLRGKRPNFNFGVNRSFEYPLRQFIVCPHCGRGLTASSSTSRDGSKHHYYHCMNNACKVRYRLNDVHSDFDEYLQSVKVDRDILDLYHVILEDVFKRDDQEELQDLRRLYAQEELIRARIRRVEDSFFDGITPQNEYRLAMERYNKEAADVQGLIREKQGERTPYKKYIAYGFSLIGHLPEYYDGSTLEVKHKILGSIFPQKLHYSEKSFRTTPLNSVLAHLLQASNELQGQSKKKVGKNADQSIKAPPVGLEPTTL